MDYTKEEIREKITTDPKWTMRAITVLYNFQTRDEQSGRHTNTFNGKGFNKFDAEFLSSLADQILSNKGLTENQIKAAQKIIGKYAGQLFNYAKEKEGYDG